MGGGGGAGGEWGVGMGVNGMGFFPFCLRCQSFVTVPGGFDLLDTRGGYLFLALRYRKSKKIILSIFSLLPCIDVSYL